MRRLMLLLVVALAACSTGAAAPPASSGDLVCNANFCVTAPDGWAVVEQGGDFTRFAHGEIEEAQATVAPVNMEAIVIQAGGTWPAQPENVVRAFWDLLDEAGSASFGSLNFVGDGSVRSRGSYENGRLWYRLIPIEGSRGLGMEVRGPNASWESHVDVFLDSLALTP